MLLSDSVKGPRLWSEVCCDRSAGGPQQPKIGVKALMHSSPQIYSDMLPHKHVMEPALSTLSEIAANLLKRQRMTEGSSADVVPQSTMDWEQLIALSKESDVGKWQAALSQHIATRTGKRRVTVLRVIQGGLS